MAYGEFDLRTVKSRFGVTTDESADLFASATAVPVPGLLRQWLDARAADAVAVNTEKARSEGIIAPVLATAADLGPPPVRLFSGTAFDVDRDRGLNGVCDYLLTRSAERFYVSNPVVAVAEAKKDDLVAGFGQCAAGMVAARIFNEREGSAPRPIFGVVTSGTVWKFLRLDGDTLRIDVPEYYLPDVGKILGVLVAMTSG